MSGTRPTHVGRGGVEVDVPPVQRQGLTATYSRSEHQPVQRLEAVAAQGAQELLRLLDGQVGRISPFDRRALDRQGDVAMHQPVADGDVEAGAQDGVDGPDGRGGEAGLPLAHVERVDVGGPQPVECCPAQHRHEVGARYAGVQVLGRLLAVTRLERLADPLLDPAGEGHRGVLDRCPGIKPLPGVLELGPDLRLRLAVDSPPLRSSVYVAVRGPAPAQVKE
jgi:hypothetical protein